MTNLVMKEADIILATGGPGMVKAAYSSGKPAVGVGAGNTPAIIDDTADIVLAVNSIIHSKTFDNGMICASEQSVIVHQNVYDAVKTEFAARGCYFLDSEETEKVRKTILINGALNAKIVGQSAFRIAELAGVTVPEGTKILIGEVESVDLSEEFAHEKLSPVLAMYKAEDIHDAFNKAEQLIADGGYGHTSSIYLNEITEHEKLDEFAARMKTCRILVNTPPPTAASAIFITSNSRPRSPSAAAHGAATASARTSASSILSTSRLWLRGERTCFGSEHLRRSTSRRAACPSRSTSSRTSWARRERSSSPITSFTKRLHQADNR